MLRHTIFLPLAFLAGQHGFALLAPYLAFWVGVQTIIVQRRQRRDLVAVTVDANQSLMALPVPA